MATYEQLSVLALLQHTTVVLEHNNIIIKTHHSTNYGYTRTAPTPFYGINSDYTN